MSRTALIAVGGNSLIRAGERGTIEDQMGNARRTAAAIVELMQKDLQLIITHGNGPQVGAALLRSERASAQVYSHSLDVCDATTQGEIGYVLQQSLHNELAAAGLQIPVATVLSQVVVSADDPAMQKPTKPIGPFYSREDIEQRRQRFGWEIVEDAARGYRRVVPSPEPIEIIEEDIIGDLLSQGVLVIAVGGGGIPVVRRNGKLAGVEAVIDKDRASALLASRLEVDLFVIATEVDRVSLDYRKPTQKALGQVTAGELEKHLRDGQFPPGSMGPKVESALRFLRDGGKEVIITSYEYLCEAVEGSAGTHITA